jgi:putative spermidine/putrescine transport system ATP-binding protein
MSDRIALLRMGHLEQIASPREIYSQPATAYAAQFIGYTNLLRGEVKSGIAVYHSLSWPVALPDGPRLFSLRPENIRLVRPGDPRSDRNAVRIRGTICHQAFHGATALLQMDCGDGVTLIVRASARENWTGERELEFAASDAVPIPESDEKI